MAEKRVNKSVVVTASLIVFAGIFGVSVLMLRQLRHNDPKYLLETAEKAEAAQQWREAAVFYTQAADRTREPKYLVNVGEMLLRDGEIGLALQSWRSALVQQPDLMDAHVKQLNLLLQISRTYGTGEGWQPIADAGDAMLKALEKKTDKTDADLAFAHHARGLALVNLEGRGGATIEQGEKDLQEAARLAPQTVEYPIDLATHYAKTNRLKEADKEFLDLLARYTSGGADASKVHLAYAQYLSVRQKTDEADATFRKAVELAGDDGKASGEAELAYSNFLSQRWFRARRDSAQSSSANELFGRIESTLKQQIERDPEGYEAYLQLALLYKVAQRFDDAVQVCEQRLSKGILRKGVDATKSRVGTFTLMLYASEASLAKAVQPQQAGNAEAKEKSLQQAEQYVKDARGEAPNHPRILAQMGRIKMARGLDRQALRDFQDADAAYTSYGTVNWENKMLLATLHLKLGESGAARTLLEAVMDRARRVLLAEPAFWSLYAQTLFQTNDLDRALAVADSVIAMDAKNADALQLKAAIFERQGKHAQAGDLIASTGSGNLKALLNARAAILQGDSDGAIKILQAALEKEPAEVRVVGALVQELLAKNRYAEANQAVNRALQAKPDDPNLKQLAILSREGLTPAQRDEALVKVLGDEPDAFKRALDLLIFYYRKNDLARTLAQINEAEQHIIARDTLLASNATTAQHLALLKTKLRIAGQLKDDAGLAAARDSAATYNVDGAGGKSVLGLYHMQRKEWDSALNAFREVLATQPSDAATLTAMGQTFLALNRRDEAEDAYDRAIRANPNEGAAHQGLAYIAQLRGDAAEFQKELAECQRLMPDDPWVDEQVTLRNEQSDPAAAIKRREAQLAEKPDDAAALQRLAWLYEIANDTTKAEAAFAKLIEKKGDDQGAVLGAIGYYRRTGRGEKAIELLRDYASRRATPAEQAGAEMLLAGEYIQQQNNKKAEEVLLAAAKKSESPETLQGVAEFYYKYADQPAKALPWLDKAIEAARQVKSAQLPNLLDARIGCSLSRAVGNVESARRDVQELKQISPDFPRGYLWNSEISARLGDTTAAINALNEYLERRANDPYALLQRARHRIAQGNTSAAMEDLQTIKRNTPLALQLEPRFMLASLERELGRPEQWVAELESIAKDASNAYLVVERLVNAYLEVRRFDDADRVVTAQINRGDPQADPRWHFLRGRVSLALGQADKALDDFRKGAEGARFSSAAMSMILEVFARLGRYADGIAFFEQHSQGRSNSFNELAKYAGLFARNQQKDEAVQKFREAMNVAMTQSLDAIRTVMDEVFAATPPAQAVELFQDAPKDSALARANDRILLRALSAAKRYDEALRLADKLIQSAPSDAARGALLAEKGDIHQNAGHADAAIADYQESLKYEGDNWVTLNNVAYLLSDKSGDNQQALGYALRAAGIAENKFTLDTLGWIYVGVGKEAQAVAELSRAIRSNPEYALPYYHLGEARRKLGQFPEAEAVLKTGRSIAESGKDTELVSLIAKSLERVGKSDKAP